MKVRLVVPLGERGVRGAWPYSVACGAATLLGADQPNSTSWIIVSVRGPSIAALRGVTPSGRAVKGCGGSSWAAAHAELLSRAESALSSPSLERILPRPSGGMCVADTPGAECVREATECERAARS